MTPGTVILWALVIAACIVLGTICFPAIRREMHEEAKRQVEARGWKVLPPGVTEVPRGTKAGTIIYTSDDREDDEPPRRIR